MAYVKHCRPPQSFVKPLAAVATSDAAEVDIQSFLRRSPRRFALWDMDGNPLKEAYKLSLRSLVRLGQAEMRIQAASHGAALTPRPERWPARRS